MKTTVVITNYNYEQYVETAIDSVLRQDVPVDELLVIDDKSTDKSIKVIENKLAQAKVPCKLIVHDVNKGLPSSRNTGITNSSGDIICFLDADDIYYKNKVSASKSVLTQYPEVNVVYSDYDVIDLRTGKTQREYKFTYDATILVQACIVSTNSVFRRKMFDTVGLYNPEVKVSEDYELYLRAKDNTLFWHIPQALFLYRLHGKNITLTQQDQMMKNERAYKARLLGGQHG